MSGQPASPARVSLASPPPLPAPASLAPLLGSAGDGGREGAPGGVRVHHTIAGFREELRAVRAAGRTVGLVPTMGALHAGHAALVARAAVECDVVAVTVFVNPLQFGDPDDIAHYPRTLDADVATVAEAGGQLVLAPSVVEMYPEFPTPVPTAVRVAGVSEPWEGASRLGHFDGVATVVAKLFAIAGPCRAYFGEKDFQQLAVVRRLVHDLSFPVELVPCSTVREEDGLAMSSRNVRLAPEERRAATVLCRALQAGADAVRRGEERPEAVESQMAAVLGQAPLVAPDYAVVVRAGDLVRPASLGSLGGEGELRLLVAAQVGPVRLIDNLDPWAPALPHWSATEGTS